VLRQIGVDNGDTIVVYGSTLPQVVARAWWVLTASGAEDVRILDGGWKAWTAAGLPVSRALPAQRTGRFVGSRIAPMVASRDDVLKAMRERSACLVNALTPEQFRGSGGAHYGRPGRIPGSVNVPNRDFVDPVTGRYRPVAEIADLFRAQGVLDQDRIITYCGGGIAAAGAAFALALIGHPNVALYDGSLLEWSADPALPMVVD
jgi:thiosulfate/3-mercaptopyruvate sulfurtransferase